MCIHKDCSCEEESPNRAIPHKHAALIKAWAEGAKIQVKSRLGLWTDLEFQPLWRVNMEYRIKPEPKPDVVRHTCSKACPISEGLLSIVEGRSCIPELILSKGSTGISHNIKVTFDGETGNLKSVEVIK